LSDRRRATGSHAEGERRISAVHMAELEVDRDGRGRRKGSN
jgi:hypothetical protein